MTWRTVGLGKVECQPTDSHRSVQRWNVPCYPTGGTSTMSSSCVWRWRSSWHGVTCRIPSETTDHLGLSLGYGKSKVTLCGYGTPPSILKKNTEVVESRPKQVPYVWLSLSIETDSKVPGGKVAVEVWQSDVGDSTTLVGGRTRTLVGQETPRTGWQGLCRCGRHGQLVWW